MNDFREPDINKLSRNQSKKILFVISEDWYFISHRFFLAKYAISKGFEVFLLTKVTTHKNLIETSGIQLINWPISRRSANIFQEIKTLLIYSKAIKQSNPEIIHAVGLKPILYGALLAKAYKIKIRISAFAGLGYVFSSTQYLAKFLRPLMIFMMKTLLKNKYSTIIMQNNDDSELFIKNNIVRKSQIKIIKGVGVDTELFFGLKNSNKTPIVLLPARLLKDKGIEDFVEIAKNLKNDGINARFVISGREDPSNPEAVDNASLKEWKQSNLIEIWGHVDDMAKAYQKASLVCLPSFREGLPKALLEAASSEKAIVTYDVPGCREVVINNVNGFLVDFRDIDQFSKAIKTLLLNDNLRKEMGKAGREFVLKNFSQEEIARQTLSLWLAKLDTTQS